MPDDPPRRVTPRGPLGMPPGGGRPPGRSYPDLYEMMEAYFRAEAEDRAGGISNRTIYEQIAGLHGVINDVAQRVAALEGANQTRAQFDTGRFPVQPQPIIMAGNVPQAPPASKSNPPRIGFLEKALTKFIDGLTSGLVPMTLAAIAAYFAGKGCH